MEAKILNTIGLALTFIGGTIWFFYGFPQPTHEVGVSFGLEPNTKLSDGRTVAERDESVRKIKSSYLCKSRLALTLISIGFAFEIWATWE